jgi:glucose-1-phosphate cytidylyltransferase
MKVVILAGGFGTRLSELTEIIPKPMAQIGDLPIIIHIMNFYAAHGHKDFIIALGYKSDVIKNYFANLSVIKSDYTVNLNSGEMKIHKKSNMDWNVTLVDTGLNTMTGGRIKRLKNYIGENDFLLTYGDGVSDVDIPSTIKLHKESSKILTMTVVRPIARFGEINIEGDIVKSFEEKPQLHQGWINGGFFVCNPSILNYIDGDKEMFEREPLQKIIKVGALGAYKHYGFWHCMDSKRDHEKLNKIWAEGNAPWK